MPNRKRTHTADNNSYEPEPKRCKTVGSSNNKDNMETSQTITSQTIKMSDRNHDSDDNDRDEEIEQLSGLMCQVNVCDKKRAPTPRRTATPRHPATATATASSVSPDNAPATAAPRKPTPGHKTPSVFQRNTSNNQPDGTPQVTAENPKLNKNSPQHFR